MEAVEIENERLNERIDGFGSTDLDLEGRLERQSREMVFEKERIAMDEVVYVSVESQYDVQDMDLCGDAPLESSDMSTQSEYPVILAVIANNVETQTICQALTIETQTDGFTLASTQCASIQTEDIMTGLEDVSAVVFSSKEQDPLAFADFEDDCVPLINEQLTYFETEFVSFRVLISGKGQIGNYTIAR